MSKTSENIREWVGFRKIINQIQLNGIITNIEPLRIGIGRSTDRIVSVVDLPVITINYSGKEIVYIPGSSLKGVLRTVSTLITRKAGIPMICDGVGNFSCGHRLTTDEESLEHEKTFKILQRKIRQENVSEIIKFVDKNYCLVCKVFGGMSYQSHVYVGDAYVVGDYSLSTKRGIAINRRTGTTLKGALYTIEFVNPGAKFNFEIYGRNLPNYVIGMLLESIELINKGLFRIGGFKSRGFGRVEFKELKLRYYGDGGPLDEYDESIAIEEREYEGGEFEEIKREFLRVWNNAKSKLSS